MARKDGSEVRRRTKKQSGKSKKGNHDGQSEKESKPAPTASKSTTEEEEEEEESFFQTLSSHWLVRYFFPIYAVYTGLTALETDNLKLKPLQHWALQDAEWINRHIPMLHLRESVGHSDERQVLIVGTMSSGTRQVASSLRDTIGLEIGHELSDSQSYYVRDGTVSWFFGIRFLPVDPSTSNLGKKIVTLCQDATFEMGFHPRMYRAGVCSEREQWSRCWAKECMEILQMEWGCAWSPNGCQFQPFRRSLHQTRHPIATVESLVAKFCDTEKQDAFIKMFRLLFGDQHPDLDRYSCLELATHYVIEYNRAMATAREKGLIHATYKVEDTTPCQAAELAGFASENDLVHSDNQMLIQTKCQSSQDSAGRQLMKPREIYKVNQDRVRLKLSDFEGGRHGSKRSSGDMTLVEEVQAIVTLLGYEQETLVTN